MNHDEFVAAIRRDGAALDVAARAAGVDAPVPSCPAWDVRALLAHQTMVHRWATAHVRGEDPEAGRANPGADEPCS